MPEPNGIVRRPIILCAFKSEEILIREQLKILTPEMRDAPDCFRIWDNNGSNHFNEGVGGHCHPPEEPGNYAGDHICILRNDFCTRLIIHEVAHAWLNKTSEHAICEEVRQILVGTKFTGVRPEAAEFARYPKDGLLTAWCTIGPEEVVAEMTAYASIFNPFRADNNPLRGIDKKDARFLQILKLVLRESFITPGVFIKVFKHIKAGQA